MGIVTKVKLVSCTEIDQNYLQLKMKEVAGEKDATDFIDNLKSPEGLMVYCARVSSPNQNNPSYEKLLNYCAKHAHWSIFEMIDVTFEIETTLPIATQMIRHRTFNFQIFSQRYAPVTTMTKVGARRQDTKNRQNSINDLPKETLDFFEQAQEQINSLSLDLYNKSLDKGIAKESARFLLPQTTSTRMFMKGNMRSWIHYIDVRADESTQLEHREIALKIKSILTQKFPSVAKAMGWH